MLLVTPPPHILNGTLPSSTAPCNVVKGIFLSEIVRKEIKLALYVTSITITTIQNEITMERAEFETGMITPPTKYKV